MPSRIRKKQSAALTLYEQDSQQDIFQQDDLAMPRLTILQALSPQLQQQSDSYIDGAVPGMIYEIVSQETYDGADGIFVLPVSYRRAYIEWRPRSDGGGFVAKHNHASVLEGLTRKDNGDYETPDGTYIAVTPEYVALVVDMETGQYQPAVISMAGSQIRKSRRWNTMMRTFTMRGASGKLFNPPMYSRIYHLTTCAESNDKGTWFGWRIEVGPMVDTLPNGVATYEAAKVMHEQFMKEKQAETEAF